MSRWLGSPRWLPLISHSLCKVQSAEHARSPASVLHGEREGAVTKPLLMSHNYVNLQWAIFMQMPRANYSFMPVGMKKSIVFQGALFLSVMRLGTISRWAVRGLGGSAVSRGVSQGRYYSPVVSNPPLYRRLLPSSNGPHRGRRN